MRGLWEVLILRRRVSAVSKDGGIRAFMVRDAASRLLTMRISYAAAAVTTCASSASRLAWVR